jgi:valyl-tRNA synthetase
MIDTKAMEEKWKEFWSNNDIFKFKRGIKNYTIDTPPPTVSGKMHVGHAFSYPQQDFIARYKRMKGYNVFYPWGFDDNGLPTERFVEKERKVTIENTPLKDYIRICKEVSAEAEKSLYNAWYDTGISADFKNYIDTSSDFSIKISQEMFLDLVEKKRAYRDEAPFITCPTCHTAISQIEMKDAMINTELVYINFNDIEIATTRPEMLGACIAIFVNPDDERYKKLIGTEVMVPLYNYKVNVMSDNSIDKEFGTGAEMLCTFGDQNDLELWKKYNLKARIILKDGKINDGKIINGLSVKDARKRIIEELKNKDYIIKTEKIKHSVNTHERCGTPIEIGISKQWYIKDLDIKNELIDFGNRIEWIPEHMKTRYDNWVAGLKWDWCISRQRYFGVPFPVWYCNNCGEIVFAKKEDLPVDPRLENNGIKCRKCGSENVTPETDVMDTWATSSLSPTLYLENINAMDLYPMDSRFQGHDIITSWAFTTILRSYLHYNKIPWKKIVISGNVYDPFGQKMSKSKGNIVEPKSIIDNYGADALRYWASTTMQGENIKLREQDLIRGHKTVIKLENSLKLLMLLANDKKPEKTSFNFPVNRWIVTKMENTIKEVTEYMENNEIMKARIAIDKFFWNIYCDNYLEIIKNEASMEDRRNETLYTAFYVMENILKMYSPIMPFITEELYHQINTSFSGSIALEPYPEFDDELIYNEEVEIDYIIDIIGQLRNLKSKMKISMAAPLENVKIYGHAELIKKHGHILKGMMHINDMEIIESENEKVEN